MPVVSRFRFADIELDLDRFEVTRAGRRLALEPKAVDVLRFFVERPGRLVTRDELLDGVWPDVAVTPNALTRVVGQLRRELGDAAGARGQGRIDAAEVALGVVALGSLPVLRVAGQQPRFGSDGVLPASAFARLHIDRVAGVVHVVPRR
jgi:hypothetical protein